MMDTSYSLFLFRLHEKTSTDLQTLEPFLQQLTDSHVESPFLLSMWIDIYEQRAKLQQSAIEPAALELCKELADRKDAIREKYWNYKHDRLQQLNKK